MTISERSIIRIITLVLSICSFSLSLRAQEQTRRDSSSFAGVRMSRSPLRVNPDSLRVDLLPHDSLQADSHIADSRRVGPQFADSLRADSLFVNSTAPDSLMTDSLSVADTLKRPRPKSMVDFPAFTAAKDSTVEDFTDGHRILYYYGNVTVKYGDMELTADYMQYDVDKQVVYAAGVADTLGNVKGKPVMKQGGMTYQMDNVFYNFKTNKATIKNMISQEKDGIMRGDNLNMMPDKSINISGGKYTVCDCEHPHYYLKMSVAKVETQPKQKTVFGPAWLVLEDVPLPMIAIPFGFVPKRPDRATGILFPTFGEEEARGLFAKDGGVYFVMGDYFDIAVTGSFYSKGSWNAKLTSRYKLRYKFNGSFDISYSNDQTGDKGSSDFFQTTNFGIKWNHAQDSKANPGTSFKASVNFSSPSNNKYNSTDINEALQSQISSSISYSKTWSKVSLSVNALHNQNSKDSSYSFTLPNITFNVNKFYPFKRKNRVGKAKWYEDFGLSYNTSFQNKISFKAKEWGSPDFWNKMQSGMKHTFNISLPSFTILKYLNLNPSVNYGMNWYFSSQNQYYNPETDKIEKVRSDMFGDFGITQTFSASASLSTRIYGIFNFKKGNLKAIRHMISPSISASFSPEMGTVANGYVVYNYTDIHGNDKTLEYNRWAGGINTPPSKGKSAALAFTIGNNLEAKIVDKKDTTGTGTKKIKIIDNLNINGSYNFLADSLRMSNIGISMNTNILEKIGLSAKMTLDPYAIDERGKKINTFNIVKQGGFNLFRLTSASISADFSISGEGRGYGNDGGSGDNYSSAGVGGGGMGGRGMNNGPDDSGRGSGGGMGSGSGVKIGTTDYTKIYYHPVTGEYIPGGWVYYLNPNVPWALTLSYSYNYARQYQYTNEQLIVKNNHTQTLSLTAQVRLTKDLHINLQSGFDITNLKITTTQLSATYDLHCFQISFSWIPLGQWKQWSFRINAKAAALADLLSYRKQSSQWDR